MWNHKPLNTTSTNASILNCFARWANLVCSASALPRNTVALDWTPQHVQLSTRNSPLQILALHLLTSPIRCCLSTILRTMEPRLKKSGFFQRSALASGSEPWPCLNQTLELTFSVFPQPQFNKTMAHGSSTVERCGSPMVASMTRHTSRCCVGLCQDRYR